MVLQLYRKGRHYAGTNVYYVPFFLFWKQFLRRQLKELRLHYLFLSN